MPKLYPFQQECVNTIEKWRGRCLLALEMGLGKTGISLRWTGLHPKRRPVIIVCPASLKLNWERELHKWLPGKKAQILEGTKPYNIKKAEYIILNYDILPKWLKTLKALNPPVLILDECAYIKNYKAKRTKATATLAKSIPHIIGISGTPIINRPVEFFNILSIIREDMFPSWWKYVHRYCRPRRTLYGLDVNGASNMEELHLKLTRSCMIRMLKSEVQKELPEKIRTVIPVPLSDAREYADALREPFRNPLQYFGNLKRAAVRAKLGTVIDWIKDVIEDNKLIAFCHHHETVDTLMTHFGKKAVKLTGKENIQQRQQAVDQFQTCPKTKLFVGNIKAAGVGINLTAANLVVFVELGWTPSDHDQAEDRAHRITQTKNVHIYYPIAAKTVEEDILTIIDHKRKVITQIIDGKLPETESTLNALLKLYKEKEVL